MTRTKIRLVVFFLLLLSVFVIRFPLAILEKWTIKTLETEALAAGIQITAEDWTLSPPVSLSFKKLNARLLNANAPFPFFLNQGTFDLSLLRAMMLRSQLQGDLEAYSGKINLNLDYSLLSQSGKVEANAAKLHLEEHPVIDGLNLSGQLSLGLHSAFSVIEHQQAEKLVKNNTSAQKNRKLSFQKTAQLTEGQAFLELIEVNYAGGYKIGNVIPIPTFANLGALLKLNWNKNRLVMEKFDALSSLGQIIGSGQSDVSATGELKELDVSFQIALSEYGSKELGGYLALAANKIKESKHPFWNLKLSGKNLEELQVTVEMAAANAS